MKTELYSHNKAKTVINSTICAQVLRAVQEVDVEINEQCRGRVREGILQNLRGLGWSDKFRLHTNSQISLTSSLGENVLCLQTGNMSRFYADLLKLQYVFAKGNATAAFYLIFSKEAAKIVGSNLAHFDRMIRELALFKETITIPILVVGIG